MEMQNEEMTRVTEIFYRFPIFFLALPLTSPVQFTVQPPPHLCSHRHRMGTRRGQQFPRLTLLLVQEPNNNSFHLT